MVREFAVRSTAVPVDELRSGGAAGPRLRVYPLGRDYPEYEDSFLVALTEQRSVADIEWLCSALRKLHRGPGVGSAEAGLMSGVATLTETPQQAERVETIFEKSVTGRRAAQLPPKQGSKRRRSSS